MANLKLPSGYSEVPAGKFHDTVIEPFGFKQTPVTNEEWQQPLHQDRFILLHHDWNTGETLLEKKGKTIGEVMNVVPLDLQRVDFDHGDVLIRGAQILVKMVDNPSDKYDDPRRNITFSREHQPVVGISYFHAKAWCLLMTLESNGKYKYDLPTDIQYEYVASAGGTKEHGTESGDLIKNGKKQAHIAEYNRGKGTTVDVDAPAYAQKLFLGVQTTGNINRWIRFNPLFKSPDDTYLGPYGLRGGGWNSLPENGQAAFRYPFDPGNYFNHVGFSPVIR